MGDLEQLLAERIAAGALALAREMAGELLAAELARGDWRRKGALSLDECADAIGISRQSVQYLIDTGVLECRRTRDGGRRYVPVVALRRHLGEC